MRRKIVMIGVGILFILGASKLSFAQTHSEHEHGALESNEQTVSEQAVNAGNKICPVSGEKIEEKTKVTYEHEGKIYNFCCPMCIDEFKKDPEKYIKKVEEELQSESKEGAGQQEQGMEMMRESTTTHQGMHGGQHH